MNEKDSQSDQPVTRTEAEGATVDLPVGIGVFATGQVLGERYEILEMLGRGGMGEVWRAFDLKLRVEVGLKALREELFQSERRLELLRQEVRAAREVVSPNVCRIFDLIEIEGRELVSMEYVDGATLLGVLQERGPLELKEAQDIASQFLAGLEAIHNAGLVHRDIKPENIMLTRAGRVVVMDFGLARGPESGAGSVSGTPAYMAPEHAAGQEVDARADVYSAGVVLAEMVSPDGIKNYESRQSVWEGVRSEPAQIPDSPWAPVIKRAVARDREGRQNSAHTLIRELEDVTLRVEGADDLHPYPGLASFTEDDAEYFFGRETEVEQMWRKLEGPPRMLGIMGPSGAGKTSFIRAGLTPKAPSGWSIIRCTPGNAAIPSLRGALTPELPSGSDTIQRLVTDPDNPDVIVDAFVRWQKGNDGALIVVDQFEELFTLSSREDQRRFALLLGRLPLEADVHVVASMRDDFASACSAHEALQPVFQDLTMLNPPTGGNLRRALVQPATKCGYRFEDDELVEEILAEVEGERGALPLLAFALARLWDKRDRDTGLLTHEAYHDIGGVGGALARHAEATVDHIGVERIPIVRELFRNLVTAEGTRAVREWDELLSIFDDHGREGIKPSPTKDTEKLIVGAGFTPARHAAAEVLRELIDARLLTSYEVREDEHEPTRHVEIIHESLLANWPRLVRWQTQDQEGAQLRDELRQAASTWDEHDRTDDYLWTGTAYREFCLWQEHYPGGLTEVEEAFGDAMTSFAGRSRSRRRLVVGTVMAALVLGLAVVGVFWRRAVTEALRAEAQKLIAVAQIQLDDDSSETIAYLAASLELADSIEARIFAIRSLWTSPPAHVLFPADFDLNGSYKVPRFSPDGQWLAAAGFNDENVLIWNARGGRPITLGGHAVSASSAIWSRWTSKGMLVTGHWTEHRVRVWAPPDDQPVQEIRFAEDDFYAITGPEFYVGSKRTDDPTDPAAYRVRSWDLPSDAPKGLGVVERPGIYDSSINRWVIAEKNRILSLPLSSEPGSSPAEIARLDGNVSLGLLPRGRGLFARSKSGEYLLWSTRQGTSADPLRVAAPKGVSAPLRLTADGRWAVDGDGGVSHEGSKSLWDLKGMASARPIELRRSGAWIFTFADFHPTGDWVVSSTDGGLELSFWPLQWKRSYVIDGYDTFWRQVVGFTADGQYLVTNWGQDRVRLWPLPGTNGSIANDLVLPEGSSRSEFVIDPSGRYIFSAGYGSGIFLLPLDGGQPRRLDGIPVEDVVLGGSFSPSGDRVAAASLWPNEEPVMRVWNVDSGTSIEFDLSGASLHHELNNQFKNYSVGDLLFVDESTLYSCGSGGLIKWNLETGKHEVIRKTTSGHTMFMVASSDRSKMLTFEAVEPGTRSRPLLHDLDSGESTPVDFPGQGAYLGMSPDGRIWVSGEDNGTILVGRFDGSEPHLLLGHSGPVQSVAISPDLKWVASAGEDKTIRLWPMPDLSKPPLHTLPREELIAKLKTLTNLRVIRDPESSTGWKLTHDPFPGWETVPTW